MKRYPANGTFELTLRCNLHCKMCMFRHADCENARLQQQELTAEQWIHMAKQAAQAGTLSLLITGGEPMLRADFPQIYEGIYAQGFLLNIYTNATLVTDRVMETLRRLPPHQIGVTLYGASNADYETICGCPDGFDRAMEGLEKLLTLPSTVQVRFTPTRDTLGKLGQLDQLLFQRFGIHVTMSSRIFKTVRGGCMQPESCRPTPEQLVNATWDQAAARLLETVALPPHPCENCKHLQSCTLCPAVAMAETGSLTGVPEYICKITHLTQKRKEEFTL